MGKHAAADGSSAHPLVAAALAQRPGEGSGAHREGGGSEGELGWPEPARPDGEGLGWPGTPGTGTGPDAVARRPEPAAPLRRGWRRLFGSSSAA